MSTAESLRVARGGSRIGHHKMSAHLFFNPPPSTHHPERRRAANKAAFKAGKDRADLYTDAWDGSEWKGGRVNILSVLILISVAVPLAGIAFAFWSYGRYWG